jgi:hypothetical protein
VAHDIGTSVATELMARDLRGDLEMPLGAALLFNGSILQDLASLKLAQKLLHARLGPLFGRMMNERLFRLQFRSLFSDNRRSPAGCVSPRRRRPRARFGWPRRC